MFLKIFNDMGNHICHYILHRAEVPVKGASCNIGMSAKLLYCDFPEGLLLQQGKKAVRQKLLGKGGCGMGLSFFHSMAPVTYISFL